MKSKIKEKLQITILILLTFSLAANIILFYVINSYRNDMYRKIAWDSLSTHFKVKKPIDFVKGGWKDSKVKVTKLEQMVEATYFDETGDPKKGHIEKGRKVIIVSYFNENSLGGPMLVFIDYKTLEVLGRKNSGI